MLRTLLAAALLLGPALPAVAEFTPEQVERVRLAAEAGDPAMQLTLGRLHHRGQGVEQDFAEANRWFHRAIDGGNAEANYDLGNAYLRGEGVAKDVAEGTRRMQAAQAAGVAEAGPVLDRQYARGRFLDAADPAEGVAIYRTGAERGHPVAQAKLGLLYREGIGVTQDGAQALHWLGLAAEQGDVEAQGAIGTLYDEGVVVEADKALAARWFRRAADAGDRQAQFNLGSMYANGVGVEKDLVQAVKWLTLSSEKVHSSRYLLYRLEEDLTPEERENRPSPGRRMGADRTRSRRCAGVGRG